MTIGRPVDFDIHGGTGFAGPQAVPVVRVRVSPTEEPDVGEPTLIEAYLTPEEATRIGIDFIRAAVMSWSDCGIRIYAKEHGVDGDTIIGSVQALVKVALDHEDKESGR